MHWNVPPDALPGSATLVRVLDRWLNDCRAYQPCIKLNFLKKFHTGFPKSGHKYIIITSSENANLHYNH